MTDVFISYARRDSALAERLAETLTALGLNVWWDRRLLPGEDWEMEIERRIDGAKAVIVIWSAESVKSRAVRAEARRADRQSKLAPVCAEPVEPPLFSSGIHYEDLSGWTGDTAAVEFQDLWAQLIALTGGVAEASHVPRDGATAIMAPVATADGAPILNMPWLNRPLGPFRSAASLLSSLMVIGFSAMMGFYREEFFGPYWEGVFLLAGTALLLFLAGERELKPNVKAMVARWLQPQPKAEPMRASAAFLALFEAVFSKRHLSLRCLWASLLASVGIYAALLLLFVPFDVLEGLVRDLIENGPRAPEAETIIGTTYVTRGFLEQNAALLFIAVPLANIFVDYLSLGQTRMILRWSARGAPLGLAVLLDAALTALIFVALLPLGPVTFVLILEAVQGGAPAVAAALEAGGKAEQTAEAIWRQLEVFVTVGWPGEALSAVAGEANVPTTALLIAFFTTFTTSAWLWFALLFAPLVRLLSWTRRSGLSWLGAAVNTRQRPIAPLGYAAASLFLIGGAAITEVADALSVKVVSEDPPAQTPFRDCADCPEMVMLAGGSFLMGSPPAEVGREPRSFIFEGPQTTVEVAPFAMARFETTFRQWDACVAETADRSDAAERCRPQPRGQERLAYVDDEGRTVPLPAGDQGWGRGLRPVMAVSRRDLDPFLAWLNRKVADKGVLYRLPSEAEWEYAARAGTTGAYFFDAPMNDASCRYLNGFDAAARRVNPFDAGVACDDGYPFTAPVGSYEPNPWGLYDMYGNVEEWTEDCLYFTHEGRPATAEARTEGCDQPQVSVLRGGSWYGDPPWLRSAHRNRLRRDYQNDDVGFRVVRVRID